MISEKIKNFIEKYNLKEPFLVAFSGGFDSMCLLNTLTDCGYKPVAIHLNHNWRGKESDTEEENCRKFANSKGIEFYSEKLGNEVPKTETSARNARYEFFKKCAKKFNSNVVFTAHNFDDNAETVLYRIIKGTGTAGLEGIIEHRDIFYRPLLSVKREDIEKYCKQKKLSPNQDSSNDNTKYKRNFIRKEIIPLMKKINPNVIEAINSLSEIAKEDIENTNEQKYFIRQLLKDNNIDYDRKKIEDISEFIDKNKNSKSGKTLSLSSNLYLFVNNKQTNVISKSKKYDKEIKIKNEGEYEFDDTVFLIKKYNNKSKIIKYPNDNEFKALVEIKDINFTLRYRKNGDIIQPLGTAGNQKFKKYLNEKKIPQHLKDKIVLLCSDNVVLWAAGLGLNDKIKVVSKPTHIIELRGKL